jgi:hypothetical protein
VLQPLVRLALFCYTFNMRKSISVTPKKRRGRPATGRDPLVTTRLPVEMIAAIGDFALRNHTSRSDAIRQLITAGLSMLGGGAAKRAKRKDDLARESAPVKRTRKTKTD